jgi:hypothetical protein
MDVLFAFLLADIQSMDNDKAQLLQRLVMPLFLQLCDASLRSALQNSRNNLPAPTKAPSNPFSRNAYQKVTALIPKIGIPTTGSNFSLTSIKLMFVPH